MNGDRRMTEEYGKSEANGCQEFSRQPDERCCSIPGSIEWVMTSKHQGCDYRIMAAVPQGPPPECGYPVIYALDGDAVFATFAEAVRLQTRKPRGYEPAIVVGIGYFSGEPFDMQRRCYDFTMPAESGNLPERPGGRDWPDNGGANGFLDFLELELMPEIGRRYSADPRKRTLFGHSLGGLFVLHALFTRPRLCRLFAAGSPSIWWNRHAVLEEIPAFEAWATGPDLQDRRVQQAQQASEEQQEREVLRYQQNQQNQQSRGEHSPRLLLTIGSEELEHMVADSEKLAERLKPLQAWGFRADLIKFSEEGHVSVLPAAISRVIKAALS